MMPVFSCISIDLNVCTIHNVVRHSKSMLNLKTHGFAASRQLTSTKAYMLERSDVNYFVFKASGTSDSK